MSISRPGGPMIGRGPSRDRMPQPRTWDVAALLLATADALSARFGAVAVRGELSNFSAASSGHCYFSLKDSRGSDALLRCAMFRRAATLLDFTPADGQQVELRGRIGVYEARGELQLIVEAMQRVGAGTLYEEFLRLRSRLSAEGLFEAAGKRPLPRHPRAIGIVTSLRAAALHDVLTAFARRAPHVRLVLYPAPVQGAEAAQALCAALRTAATRREVDTLLLVRGGGSLEDLWPFNDERVVRAVVASPIPVVCGVGHETDVTLCDLAADLRAPTPTAAAELAAPASADLLATLSARAVAMQRAWLRTADRQAQRLDTVAMRLGRPAALLTSQQHRLDGREHGLRRALLVQWSRDRQRPLALSARLGRAVEAQLQRWRGRSETVAGRLAALDPHRVLHRGYAWIEAGGRPVTTVAGLAAGQCVEAVWADGRASARLLTVRPAQGLGDGDDSYNRSAENNPG